ncbi:MAG: acyltransferase [Clostridiaceae bacterium]|nr:acyltransferase [Clostridiaceae bacterium]
MFWFNLYSWITGNLCVGDLFPQFIRTIVFRHILKNFGKGSVIDYKTYIRYPSRVSIGSHTTINRGCHMFASFHCKEVEIFIGNHVAIAPDVYLLAAGHDYTQLTLPDTAGSITVGDYVWIGARSTILQGVTIGEGAVIAAGSVVTRDIPPYTVAAGVPARVIRRRMIQNVSASVNEKTERSGNI